MGGAKGDGTRNIQGTYQVQEMSSGGGTYPNPIVTGPFYSIMGQNYYATGNAGQCAGIGFNASLVVPTGAVNLPRSWGALACCYLGQPAA